MASAPPECHRGVMEARAAYEAAVEAWTARVLQVGPEQWAAPTPCTEWDVRALVNHVVGEDLWTGPLMRGATIAEVGDRFDGDLLGDQPRETALEAAREAVAAVAETLPSHGVVHLSYGDEQADEYVAQLTADHVVHAWDLAAATGSSTEFDADLTATVAAWFAGREEMYRSAGIIGPRAKAAGDDPWSMLLAASGRDARWAAAK